MKHACMQCVQRMSAVVLAGLFPILLALPVAAEQFLMLDTTVVHDIVAKPPYHGWHSHHNLTFPPGIPTNWNTPIDYYNGKAELRIQIFEKPTKRDATYQVCINRSAKLGEWHTCITCVPHFTEPGVYTREQNIPDMFVHKKPNYSNFTGGYPQLVLKSNTQGRCSCPVTSAGLNSFHCWDGYPDMKEHYPIKVRTTVYIVAKGDEFDAPGWWNEEVSAEPAGRTDMIRRNSLKLDARSTRQGTIEIAFPGRQRGTIELVRPDGSTIATRCIDAGESRLSVRSRAQGVYIVRFHAPGGVVQRNAAIIR